MRKSILIGAAALGVALAVVFAGALLRWNEARALDDGVVAMKNGDYAKAVELLTPLSDAGNPVARESLALLYGYGLGVKRDRERAARLLAGAGVSNPPDRFFSVGKALAWFKFAADAGEPQASARLASPDEAPEKSR
jgi:TPR repeat protein